MWMQASCRSSKCRGPKPRSSVENSPLWKGRPDGSRKAGSMPCPWKPNGSMPAGRERRRPIASGDAEQALAGVAWYGANAEKRTHEVGEKQPNIWGIHDMHGNVWDWCKEA